MSPNFPPGSVLRWRVASIKSSTKSLHLRVFDMILHAGSNFLQSFACHQTDGTNKTYMTSKTNMTWNGEAWKTSSSLRRRGRARAYPKMTCLHVMSNVRRVTVSPLIFFDEVKRLKEAGEAEISFEEMEMWALKSVKPVKPVTIQESAVTTVAFIVLEENVLFPPMIICHSREEALPFLHAKKQKIGRNSVAICMRYFKKKWQERLCVSWTCRISPRKPKKRRRSLRRSRRQVV